MPALKDLVVLISLGLVGVILAVMVFHISTVAEIHASETQLDFTYSAHYVKFHIHPDREGIPVTAWASDAYPPTTGDTDNNSEIVFPMVPAAKYDMIIGDNGCEYTIYPVETSYILHCYSL